MRGGVKEERKRRRIEERGESEEKERGSKCIEGVSEREKNKKKLRI